MKPDPHFMRQPYPFWALSKFASEALGYSNKAGLKRYSAEEISNVGKPFAVSEGLALIVMEYLNYRAELIENTVKSFLMDRAEAQSIFEELRKQYRPSCSLPLNKQKAEKRHYNYLTCIVNILTESIVGAAFNDSPRGLCTITDEHNRLLKTLSRWMDGAYPDIRNPIAIWEIKEYYGTTTFGSRVADGVYESQLDGYEIIEAGEIGSRKILHYLIVDDKFTWWKKGKSYLCRLIDMMHTGLVDEVIFGREVLTRWPEIVSGWPQRK